MRKREEKRRKRGEREKIFCFHLHRNENYYLSKFGKQNIPDI